MHGLPSLIAVPKGSRETIQFNAYDHGCLYGLTRDQDMRILDLNTGLIREGSTFEEFVRCNWRPFGDQLFIRLIRNAAQNWDKDKRPSDEMISDWLEEAQVRDATLASENMQRLLIALATHQVSGDKIIQGLKAIGIEPWCKLQDSYLGGWNTTRKEDGERVSVVSLISCLKYRKLKARSNAPERVDT